MQPGIPRGRIQVSSLLAMLIFCLEHTRIIINKGMVNKGKYWIFERNKDVSVSNFGEPKGRNKGIQYWISF